MDLETDKGIDARLAYRAFRLASRKAGFSLYHNMYGHLKDAADIYDYRILGLVKVEFRGLIHPFTWIGKGIKKSPVAEIRSAPWINESDQLFQVHPARNGDLELCFIDSQWKTRLDEICSEYQNETGLPYGVKGIWEYTR